MAETVGKISLQRRGTFYDSTAPRSFTVESEQNTFYRVGQGGGEGRGASSMFTRRCGARLEETIVVVSPRVLILVRNGGVPSYLWGRVNDSTWRHLQLLKKRGWRRRFT